MIRRWYWETEDSPRRIKNSLKSWKLRQAGKKKTAADSDSDSNDDGCDEFPMPNGPSDEPVASAEQKAAEEHKKKELEASNAFSLKWYPTAWIVWYCYGPPLACGQSEFRTTGMNHLLKIRRRKDKSEEEEIADMATASKYVRRHARGKKGSNAEADDVAGDSNDENATTALTTETGIRKIELVRPIPVPTRNDHLDRAIGACKDSLVVMESMNDDGIFNEEIKSKNASSFLIW